MITSQKNKKKLMLTIDVEDWFSSENLSGYIKRETWNNQQIRIEENVHNILKMLDDYSVKATFFCLGWITNKIPKLISEISNIGHEIASHGYHHKLIYNQKPDEFKLDIIKSKNQLEDITGIKVRGYRAPTFSITDWSLDILLELGFEYDSSLVLTNLHDRYGKIENNHNANPGDIFEIQPGLTEFSLPCIQFIGQSLPIGGGGYFRLLPFWAYHFAFKNVFRHKDFVFYFHPWEIDENQPRISQISYFNRFRQYIGLSSNDLKLRKLISYYKNNCVTLTQYNNEYRKTLNIGP
jgi:polysaccharide deacetylase family protein (PEP-CTERM system associated)